MPITPFHFGPGLLLKAYLPARLSWTLFALANILIDLEPITWFLFSGEPAHRQLHSYPGATLVIAACLWPGWSLAERWLRWWNRQLSPAQARWLGCGTRITFPAALFGAALGAYSHILLDSFMHADMQPLWPWSAENGLLSKIPIDGLHLICLAAAVWGGLRLALGNRARLPDGRMGTALRTAGRLLDLTLLVLALIFTLALAIAVTPHTHIMDSAPFDARAWRQTPAKLHHDNPRVPMARAALRHLEKERPPRDAALALLGVPDAGNSATHLGYYLGFSGWLAMDPDTLDIEFQPDGSFVSAHIIRH